MSEHNMLKAKAKAIDLLRYIILFVLAVDVIVGMLHIFLPIIKLATCFSVVTAVPMIFGVTEIIIGYLFVKYERDGDQNGDT